MLAVRSAPAAGVTAQVVLLAMLAAAVGLGWAGWVVGVACGVVANAGLARGLTRHGRRPGPADLVTLGRATCASGVAALVADAFLQQPAVRPLLALTVAALVLDAVDGLVARRTRTASAFGARFDGEVDAFLILVLSVYVARTLGGWVLAIGAARYAFAVAGWGLPWLRGRLPARYWRKVVAATQGVVLAFAAAGILPSPVTRAALSVALLLLAESFGRDMLWLWRHRRSGRTESVAGAPGRPASTHAGSESAGLPASTGTR